MGVSSSPAELSRKLNGFAKDVGNTRIPLNATALAVKNVFIATEPGVVGHRVARGLVGVRYTIRGAGRQATALVRFTGPAHLALNPTSAHGIEPRRRRRRGGIRRALVINGNVRAWANHPGTRGKDPGARRAKAAAAAIAPRVYARAGLTGPLRRNF